MINTAYEPLTNGPAQMQLKRQYNHILNVGVTTLVAFLHYVVIHRGIHSLIMESLSRDNGASYF